MFEKRLLQGTVPPSCLQSLIRSNQHRREKLQSRLISQNRACVMGNKWATTANCSGLLHALWLIQSQRGLFLEQHIHVSFSLLWGKVWKWGTLTALTDKMAQRGEVCKVFSVFVIVISARLPIVNSSQGSLQPEASEVMRNVDLILSSSPHYSWESRQGVKKGTFVSPTVLQTKG